MEDQEPHVQPRSTLTLPRPRDGARRGLVAASLAALVNCMAVSGPWAAGSELFGGWEGDSRQQGYGYVTAGRGFALGGRTQLAVHATGSYLYYRVQEVVGHTDVSSPGASVMLGPRWPVGQGSATLSAGAELRWDRQERVTPGAAPAESESRELAGAFQGLLYLPVASRNAVLVLGHYGAASEWLLGKVDVKRRLVDDGMRPSLGFDLTGQGNGDVRSVQVGALVEARVEPLRANITLRGGYKRVRYSEADRDEDGAFVGADFYMQFD